MKIKEFFKNLFKRNRTEKNSFLEALLHLKDNTNVDFIKFYIPEDPLGIQIYHLYDSFGKLVATIEGVKEGTRYHVYVTKGETSLFEGFEEKISKKMILDYFDQVPFFLDKDYVSGDKRIRNILTKMTEKDVLRKVEENRWIIKRKYPSGAKKWAEFIIKTKEIEIENDDFYRVQISYGHNTKSFRDSTKEYTANYPYLILNSALKK